MSALPATGNFDVTRYRVAALAEYGILDTPVEPAFDVVTRMASTVLEMPIAIINLVEEKRQWFKSEIGIGCRETPIESSICTHAIRQSGILEIEDLAEDGRTGDNPLVVGGPGFRYYAGAVLNTADGVAIGTVCVLDYKPRKLSEPQKEILRGLAVLTMAQLS